MIDIINKKINIHQLMKEKIEVFKEMFVEYYGEENREFIEYKFSHLATIGFVPVESLHICLIDLEKEISKKVLSKIDLSSFPLDEKEIFENYHLEYYSITPIGKCENFIDYIRVGKEQRLEDFRSQGFLELKNYINDLTKEEFDNMCTTGQMPEWVNKLPLWLQNNINYITSEDGFKNNIKKSFDNAQPFFEKFYPGITFENFDQLISENREITNQLIQLSDKVRECKKEYNEEKQKYNSYYEQVDEKVDLSTKLSNEYFKEFVLENIDLVPENDKEATIDALKRNNFYSLSDRVQSIFGNNILSNLSVPVYAFSTDAEEKLNSEKATQFTKSTIIKDRIRFFKKNGVDLGDNYEDYLESAEARSIWPSKERIDALNESYNKIKNKYNNQLYTSLTIHKRLREEIDRLGLLGKDDGFDAAMHTNPTTCVVPNLIDTPNGPELFPLVFVIPDSDAKYTDHKIIHELNHIMELSIEKINDNSYDAICGWDNLSGNYNDTREDADTISDRKIRPYEQFNEIINEIIAQEISELMHNKGIVIVDDPEKTAYVGCTSYERTFFIVKDFYKEFKETIIKSRRNGNIQIIFDEVGKENFDELNSLFQVYKDNFNEFSFGRTLMERKEGKVTEGTKILEDILARRDKILDKMRMHSVLKASTNQQEEQNNYEMRQG